MRLVLREPEMIAEGTTREVRKFLWWPVKAKNNRTGDKEIRWLERVHILQVFGIVGGYDYGGTLVGWKNDCFLDP